VKRLIQLGDDKGICNIKQGSLAHAAAWGGSLDILWYLYKT